MDEYIFIPCQGCGTVNRVQAEKATSSPRCAKCKAPLEAGRPVHVSDEQFGKVIGGTNLPVLVDFYATWCGPCKSMAPVLDQIATRHQGRALVAKVDTDQSPGVAGQFGIRGVPTFIVFKDGREVGRQVGAVAAAKLESMLNSHERRS